jgi:hypothetical protein
MRSLPFKVYANKQPWCRGVGGAAEEKLQLTNDPCTDAINRVSTLDPCTDAINRVSTLDS